MVKELLRWGQPTACVVVGLTTLFWCGCAGQPRAVPAAGGTADLKSKGIQIIEQALSDEDPQIRANAAEVVADTRQTTLMPRVRLLLRDDFVPVRFTAAVTIGSTGFSGARNDVAKLLNDPDENVRIAAAYAMYKLGSRAGLEVLRKAAGSKNLRVRANAAFLLGKSGDAAALDLLYKAMNDDNSDDMVRLNAVEAIARLGDERIYNKLWTMLISAYADVRVSGVRAMGALGTARAKDALLTMLDDDLPEVRLVAAEQLGALGDTSGEAVVIDVLSKRIAADAESRDRLEVLAALAAGKIRTEPLARYLPRLLDSQSRGIRIAAAKAVLESGRGDNIGL